MFADFAPGTDRADADPSPCYEWVMGPWAVTHLARKRPRPPELEYYLGISGGLPFRMPASGDVRRMLCLPGGLGFSFPNVSGLSSVVCKPAYNLNAYNA